MDTHLIFFLKVENDYKFYIKSGTSGTKSIVLLYVFKITSKNFKI